MVFFLIGIITTILGIVGFFIGYDVFLYISAGFYVFETIRGLLTQQLRSLRTTIFTICISAIVSFFVSCSLIKAICIGLTIESAVMTIFGIVMMIISGKSVSSKSDNEE